MNRPIRYVVIEDEPAIRRFLKASQTPEEAEWHEAEAGEDGIKLVSQVNPDVVLLDLGLPDIDGLVVLKRLREWTQVPVIVLSARGLEQTKVEALDSGADDYLTKPFLVGELMARVRVALRHAKRGEQTESSFAFQELSIDFVARTVTLSGEEVRLTQIEYRLLNLLVRNQGRVVTQRQILQDVWGPEFLDATHTLRVHMGNLRQKIESDPGRPKFIRTETGVGYRFMTE